ncbi:hypothetical protein [Thermosinus carboxydivorans]|nr:hypothetical protein [Thermosinus carboxydivorans]
MEFKFTIINSTDNHYKVKITIEKENKVVWNDVLDVVYDGMVLLNLNYIKEQLQDAQIRMAMISRLKKFISEFHIRKHGQ